MFGNFNNPFLDYPGKRPQTVLRTSTDKSSGPGPHTRLPGTSNLSPQNGQRRTFQRILQDPSTPPRRPSQKSFHPKKRGFKIFMQGSLRGDLKDFDEHLHTKPLRLQQNPTKPAKDDLHVQQFSHENYCDCSLKWWLTMVNSPFSPLTQLHGTGQLHLSCCSTPSVPPWPNILRAPLRNTGRWAANSTPSRAT